MRISIFPAVLVLAVFTSCKPKKAIEFKQAIVQKERAVFHILADKEGLKEKVLDCLIKEDFTGAALAVDKEEQAFNDIIRDIETLPAAGIKQGEQLKTAAADYYTGLKDIELFTRNEIAQQAAMLDSSQEKVQFALDRLLQLSRDKKKMYEQLYKKEAALHNALETFETANGL